MRFLIPSAADFVDIILIALIVYYLMQLIIKKAGGLPILLGISIAIVVYMFASISNLEMISSIFRSIKDLWLVLFLVLFQAEIKQALSKLGQGGALQDFFTKNKENNYQVIINSVSTMSFTKRGALIVFERNTKLNNYMTSGEILDSVISQKLLLTIFNPKTTLHDGAVIIRGNRIYAVKVVLPLSKNAEYAHSHGTRHLAGVGITEETDACSVIVSEETGRISFASDGVLFYDLAPEELLQKLINDNKK